MLGLFLLLGLLLGVDDVGVEHFPIVYGGGRPLIARSAQFLRLKHAVLLGNDGQTVCAWLLVVGGLDFGGSSATHEGNTNIIISHHFDYLWHAQQNK